MTIGMTIFFMILISAWLAQRYPKRERPWPALPTIGFIAGRTAEPWDVEQDNAIFAHPGRSRILVLPIPQYALYHPEKGPPLRAVLVQAELVDGEQLLGLRLSNGQNATAGRCEVELLGRTTPG